MPLRLVNKQRTHDITACDTIFKIISMTVGEKERLLEGLVNVGGAIGAFDRLLDVITPAIVKIEGFDGPVIETLKQLEEIEQLRDIVNAIIAHCSMAKDEAKNLSSSPEQPIPDSVGNAGEPA